MKLNEYVNTADWAIATDGVVRPIIDMEASPVRGLHPAANVERLADSADTRAVIASEGMLPVGSFEELPYLREAQLVGWHGITWRGSRAMLMRFEYDGKRPGRAVGIVIGHLAAKDAPALGKVRTAPSKPDALAHVVPFVSDPQSVPANREAIMRFLTALKVEGDKAPPPVHGGRAARAAVCAAARKAARKAA